MRRFLPVFAFLTVLAVTTTAARAAIVTTGPSAPVAVTVVATPPTGTLNEGNAAFESNTNLFIWQESRQVLPGTVAVDWSGIGSVTLLTQTGGFSVSGEVTSYYLRFDPVGQPGTGVSIPATPPPPVPVPARVTFDRHIIGVMTSGATQSTTDATFAPAGLTYGSSVGTPNLRGIELFSPPGPPTAAVSDRFTISPDGRTLIFDWVGVVNQGVDTLRIITNPEPGTLALFGLGVLGLGGLVRRRRRKRSSRA